MTFLMASLRLLLCWASTDICLLWSASTLPTEGPPHPAHPADDQAVGTEGVAAALAVVAGPAGRSRPALPAPVGDHYLAVPGGARGARHRPPHAGTEPRSPYLPYS